MNRFGASFFCRHSTDNEKIDGHNNPVHSAAKSIECAEKNRRCSKKYKIELIFLKNMLKLKINKSMTTFGIIKNV